MSGNILLEIERRTGREYMLRQLAEEAVELAQAALKLIRAEKGETPMPVDRARRHFIEELADLDIMTTWARRHEMNKREFSQLLDIRTGKLERFDRRTREWNGAKGDGGDE